MTFSMLAIMEITSVFYLVSLDSADVLAIKVYFQNHAVSEIFYETRPTEGHAKRETCICQ